MKRQGLLSPAKDVLGTTSLQQRRIINLEIQLARKPGYAQLLVDK